MNKRVLHGHYIHTSSKRKHILQLALQFFFHTKKHPFGHSNNAFQPSLSNVTPTTRGFCNSKCQMPSVSLSHRPGSVFEKNGHLIRGRFLTGENNIHENKDGIPKMMGLGKGGSGLKYGHFRYLCQFSAGYKFNSQPMVNTVDGWNPGEDQLMER